MVELSSELDALTAPAFQRRLDDELTADPRGLVIDLSRCGFIGSPGLVTLVRARARARAHAQAAGVWFALTAPNITVTRALAVTGLDAAFTIYTRTEESIDAYLDETR